MLVLSNSLIDCFPALHHNYGFLLEGTYIHSLDDLDAASHLSHYLFFVIATGFYYFDSYQMLVVEACLQMSSVVGDLYSSPCHCLAQNFFSYFAVGLKPYWV
mmetsp:Transcript_286/g.440  ORF Transcript_286/g.440 Transcript_286/m.440 type:complete len:102 (+) Transcript_286:314-619(+)